MSFDQVSGHGFLHRENLTTGQTSPVLNDIMSVAVKTVIYTKKNALHSGCFTVLYDNFDADHLQFFYHSEIR